MTRAREAETKYVGEQNELEITKAREMANIETEKFNNMVRAIGSDTISAIATSGPEMQVCSVCVRTCVHCTDGGHNICTNHPLQVKLLQSLGLRSTLITDGSQPVNLFTTAQGLLGAIGSGPSNPEEED